MLFLLLGMLIKVMLWYSGYIIINKFYTGVFKISLAWLYGYLIMAVSMLLLSFNNHLTGKNLIICLVIYIILFWCIAKIKGETWESLSFKVVFDNKIYNLLAVCIVVCVVLLLFYHNIIYYDTTDDALTQGMTKLAFIQQHSTLFVHYNTVTINTFSNEWFSELNGLYYLLVTGKDNFVFVGNTEVYIFILCVLFELVNYFSYKGKNKWVIVGYLGTTPVLMGLAMTIKTDLASCVMVGLMIVIFREYFQSKEDFGLMLCIAMVGIVAATKITVVPVAGLYAIALVIYYFIHIKNKKFWPIALGVAEALVFSSRYIINLIVYHNPFQRALNEKVSMSFGNLLVNIKGIISRFFETRLLVNTLEKWSSHNWAITKGIGYGGELIFILIVGYSIYKLVKRKIISRDLKYLILPYLGGLFYVLIGTIWYEWSFRYFYPYIFIIEVLAIIKVFNYMEKSQNYKVVKTFSYSVLLIMLCLNSVRAFREGQAIPVSENEALRMSKIEKKLLYSDLVHYNDIKEIPQLVDILESGGSGLVLDEFSVPYYEFFGDDNCVQVDLVADKNELLQNYQNTDYDFIAIASLAYDESLYTEFEKEMQIAGYQKYTGSYGAVFMK